MIVACVAVPLLLALAAAWLPRHAALGPVCAGATLAACLSLPWTGSDLGPLTPDPLGIHGAILASFAWFAASLTGRDDRLVPVLAGVAACLNLALLAAVPELTIVAAGAAVFLALLAAGPATGSGLAIAAAGVGLAVFGIALMQAGIPAAPDWAALPDAARQAGGASLGAAAALVLLGLGTLCLFLPVQAALGGAPLPRSMTVMAAPLAGVWLVVALRLRGVLDGNGHALAPGGLLEGAGLALMLLALACLRPGPVRLPAAALLGMVGAALFGIGLGTAAGTAASLLHLTIGCTAVAAAAAGGWAGTIGLAALVGVPPLGLFASAYGLLGAALAHSLPLAAAFAVLELAFVLVALRSLPSSPSGRASPVGWASLALTLGAGWALPPGAAAWLLGIAAVAR